MFYIIAFQVSYIFFFSLPLYRETMWSRVAQSAVRIVPLQITSTGPETFDLFTL
jgi:hypothetical protein